MKRLIIGLLALGAIIAITVYVYATYGNKPISEIPAWVLMFLK